MERFLSKMKSYNLILDNFLSNVVNTLEPDRIYDAMMDTFQELARSCRSSSDLKPSDLAYLLCHTQFRYDFL